MTISRFASVTVRNAVRAPVRPPAVRDPLLAAAALPELAGRLPEPWELTVRLTGDRELRRLNSAFLGEDRATDVLSFPAGEDAGGYLGDIAISWPAVERQAAEHGHAAEAELALLVTHGFLHLLGFDHASGEEEREMWRLTRLALTGAGVSIAAGRL